MSYRRFLSANVVGALGWAVGPAGAGAPGRRPAGAEVRGLRGGGVLRRRLPRRWVSAPGSVGGVPPGGSVAIMGRHTQPGTGAPTPDTGFWVRIAAAGVVLVLALAWWVSSRGGDDPVTHQPGPHDQPPGRLDDPVAERDVEPPRRRARRRHPRRARRPPPSRRSGRPCWPSRSSARATSPSGCPVAGPSCRGSSSPEPSAASTPRCCRSSTAGRARCASWSTAGRASPARPTSRRRSPSAAADRPPLTGAADRVAARARR